MNKRKLLLVFLVLTVFSLFGQDIPVFDKTEIKVGISAFSSQNLSPRNFYVSQSLALLLSLRLEEADQHRFSSQEIEVRRMQLLENASQSSASALTQFYKSRDALIFQENQEDSYADYSRKIEESLEEYSLLKDLDPLLIEIPEVLPLSWESNTGESRLFPAIRFSPKESIGSLDLLVYGSVEEYDEYFFVEVRLYNAILERDVLVFQTAGGRDELEIITEEASDALLDVLTGQARASLVIEAEPKDAFIYVNDQAIDNDFIGDGTFLSIGEGRLSNLAPGALKITIKSPGYLSLSEIYNIESGDHLNVNISLEKQSLETIEFVTDPSLADLYMDSVWMGKTPLSIDRPLQFSRLEIKKEGFMPTVFSLDPLDPRDLYQIELSDIIVDYKKELEEKKIKFYNSLAVFSASLILPIVGYTEGNAIITTYGSSNLPVDVIYYAKDMYNIFTFGLFLSAGTLVNAGINLYDYLNSARQTFN